VTSQASNRTGRKIIAAFLVLTAALFAIATTIERSNEEPHREDTVSRVEEAEQHRDEAGEVGESAEEGESADHGADERTILGVNPESPALIALGVLLSLILAGAVLHSDATPILGAIAVFAIGFAALDLVEANRQAGEHDGLLAAAITLAIGHSAAGLLSLRALNARR
jgi:hypothetical protein